MDVSWNRPTIALNNLPAYSRFQNFMLRNAGRSMESTISTHALYDGGESKVSLFKILLQISSYNILGWALHDLYHTEKYRH